MPLRFPLSGAGGVCADADGVAILFIRFKNDTDGILSDDELLRAMKYLYDSKGHGSLEYLENATLGDITSAAFGRDAEAGDGEDDAWDG